ncbi:hypothetical protein Q1695_011238 [Nippostrongylus brasiliensis]|nr:hypothetical protein Q1695_011238 [Nippostrongylus brasiliensis]
MKRAAALVRAATDLPRRGDDFELCNSFSAFTAFMEQQETRIQLILGSLMRNTGCPTRMPKLYCEAEEYIERIVMVDDHIVERAGILMDELDRGGREDVEVPKAVIGAESTKRRKAEAEANFQERIHSSDPGFVLAEQLRLAHEEAKAAKVANVSVKPQKEYGFESSIDNSTNPFVSKLRTKHHALPRKEVSGMIVIDENDGQKRNVGNNSSPNDVDDSSHPYTYEIQNFVVPDSQMESRPPVKPLDFKDTPLRMVKTKEDLELLRDTLNKCKEFAVDLEHHDFRSYLGITCLLQISTRTEDFIIDPFPLWNEMHILNEPFTDPAILKVFHGSEHDIEWLQRDFGIYVVNMFDTGRAMRLLDMQKFNLRFLVHHYCDVLLDKKFQLADWRERPLDEEMINYARGDTHYLLYCYDRLREDLLEKGDQLKNLLRVLYSESAFICATVYRKPDLDKDGLRGLERRRFNNRQEAAVQVLWHWRDKVAREEDESVQYVLPNHMLLTIAETLPRELQGILHCCNPVPPLVRECVHDLHKMIFKCRDIPLVEYKDEVTTDTYEQLLRQINMRGQFTKENIFIMCPLDFSQTEFDEESGNLVSATKSENALSVAERPPTHTLLTVLDSATTLGKDVGCDPNTHVVLDKEAAANPTAAEKVLQRLQATATPYENYTIAVTQAKKKEAEEKSKEADDVQVITKPEKRYTHHDPVATPPSVPTQLKVNEDDIDLTDAAGCAENSSTPRFDECQLRTRKEMKRARKQSRKNADVSVEVPQEEGPSYTVKRIKKDADEKKPATVVESFDYSRFDKNTFNQKPAEKDKSFDPFNQKYRVENKKNFRRRGRGGHHRMGTMSIGYKPSQKK